MLKKLNDFLAGVPATIVAGLFLLLDLVPHLVEEFGGRVLHLEHGRLVEDEILPGHGEGRL